MIDFTINNPTIVHFGKDVMKDLGKTLLQYGTKVMLIYGQGSVFSNGIYDEISEILTSNELEVLAFGGIRPNPVIEDVDKAANEGRKFNPDVILAVGGGSVIDSAKIISLTIPVSHSGWDFIVQKAEPEKAVPVVCILTLAATGTEMNQFAVVQNDKAKLGMRHPMMFPRHSFLNPSYTLTVSAEYTAFGLVDIMAHALENYFGKGDAPLTDRFVFSILKEIIDIGPSLMNDLSDLDLRARALYASSNALNGLTVYGKVNGDWGVHALGHHLSLLFDTPHGESLAIMYPAWLKHMKSRIAEKLLLLGKEVFDVKTEDQTINALTTFFLQLGVPVKMKSLGITQQEKEAVAQLMIKNKAGGMHYPLSPEDIICIVDLAY